MATCPRYPDKQQHQTREEALTHQSALVWKNHNAGEDWRSKGLSPYPCEHCGYWHVGHQEGSPTVYHYTLGIRLDAINSSGKLKVRRVKPKAFGKHRALPVGIELRPLLWFSRNVEWERSVWKLRSAVWGERARWQSINEVQGEGLVRFLVASSQAKLRWSDYLARNPTPPTLRDYMAQNGNPVEWLATDKDIPLDSDVVRGVEVYYGEQGWVSADLVEPDAFDAYLAQRAQVYDVARQSLGTKIRAAIEPKREESEEAIMSAIHALRPSLSEAERILMDDFNQDWKVHCWVRGFRQKRKKMKATG